MIKSLKALLDEWEDTRALTLSFINDLSEEDFNKKLPRKKLNTISWQVYELTMAQRGFVDSFTTETVKFDDDLMFLESIPKQAILERMAKLDAKLEESLELMDGTEVVSSWGDRENVHKMMAAMISHESMHIGQIIAFCYAIGIEIPEKVVDFLLLEG